MSDAPRRRHRPCRERIYAFRNPPIYSDFDCSARPQVLPPPDGGGAPEGRRERKSWQFLPEKFGFSGFSNLARWPRSPANNSEACPISPSAAPPQLPRQEELRPGRAVRRAQACVFHRLLLPVRQIPIFCRVTDIIASPSAGGKRGRRQEITENAGRNLMAGHILWFRLRRAQHTGLGKKLKFRREKSTLCLFKWRKVCYTEL